MTCGNDHLGVTHTQCPVTEFVKRVRVTSGELVRVRELSFYGVFAEVQGAGEFCTDRTIRELRRRSTRHGHTVNVSGVQIGGSEIERFGIQQYLGGIGSTTTQLAPLKPRHDGIECEQMGWDLRTLYRIEHRHCRSLTQTSTSTSTSTSVSTVGAPGKVGTPCRVGA